MLIWVIIVVTFSNQLNLSKPQKKRIGSVLIFRESRPFLTKQPFPVVGKGLELSIYSFNQLI